MSPSEIIQKLARHFNEEIKYAIIGHGITHMDNLVILLKNFDKIGPSYTNKGETRDGRIREEIYYDQQINRSHEQQFWRSQQQMSPQENYLDRMERNQGQRPRGNQVTNNRQIDVAEGIIIQNNMLQQPRKNI